MIKISDLIKTKLHPLIHGALLSRLIISDDHRFFAAISSYQKSTKVNDLEFKFDSYTETYVKKLNLISKSNEWITYENYKKNFSYCGFKFHGKEKALYIIENDLKISKQSAFSIIYRKLYTDSKYIEDDVLSEDKKNFIRGFCELRGSVDTTRPLLAMDYFYDSQLELGKARILNEYMSVPYYIINLNFRQLQNQFLSGDNKRNTQLRLQLSWYSKHIGFINDYKSKIIEKTYFHTGTRIKDNIKFFLLPEIEHRKSNLFITRLNHFSNKLFDRKLTQNEVKSLRIGLGFELNKEIPKNITTKRNREIVELVRLYTADECAGCKNIHDISNRSFTHRKTGRPYFEIHHNISLSNDVDLDHENNLVKLCPVCHSCIKSGVGIPNEQKEIIKKILHNNESIKEFAQEFFDLQNDQLLIKEIFQNLR